MSSVVTPTRRLVLGQIAATLAFLPTPAPARDGAQGPRVLAARDGGLRLLSAPARETPILGYDGLVPGPLLRAAQGDQVALRLVNELTEPVTFSLQGLRVQNAMAGVAGLTQPAVAPGESFDYRFPASVSGVSWYQSHVLPRTAEQIGKGLYGVLIVDEPKAPVTDRDLVIVLADWVLDREAGVVAGPDDAAAAAPLLTVNSRPAPLREVVAPRARIRLRIASAATSRVLPLVFTDARPQVLAVDGTPCEPFVPARDMIPVGPGALHDLMLDMPNEAGAEVTIGLRGEAPLVVLATAGEPRGELAPIAALELDSSLPTRIKLEAARRADLVIENSEKPGHWKLNGAAVIGFPEKPLVSVKHGTPVSLGFVNRSQTIHQMRVHGHYVRILHDLDDGWEPYWRNCVLVPPGKTKRVAFVADAPGKWPIEGLMHESRSFGLATWFEVR